ncbi:nucleotidyl transferase AbiEii/AbiGii toxin family protein [Streptomyces aureocirculatus]|uniref:nucleotidyl transferase AbiEii/AbiGii toxin family protein n=1 Tax=Streptomyces aureocirculatus TaxID=67275 RepID=UPI00099CC9BE|nr:nucleotidyl transferase AbiEii/AbiGii toxin family protein [Streptomyces aureocirculatus]
MTTPSGSSPPPPPDEAPWTRLWAVRRDVPHTEPGEDVRHRQSLPRTLLPAPHGMAQPLVFEPALKQYSNAYRAGEPRFPDEESARGWRRARHSALDTVLAAIADGPWGDHLVLRGSVLLAHWCGDAARDPGDLDFVVVPKDLAMDDPRTVTLFDDIARDAEAASAEGPVHIDGTGAVTEDIWTYDRVPGRRMLLPWTAAGTAGGTVQLDVVFNETLPTPGRRTALGPLGDGPGCRVLAVSPQLSLAWKLLWLTTDTHPQGKDLYDAVLLAEHTPPDYATVRAAFVHGGEDGLRPPDSDWMARMCVADEWEHFEAEYPWVTGGPAPYEDRLARALAPLLTEVIRPGGSAYARTVRWLHPLIEESRAGGAPDPARALGYLAGSGRDGLVAAVVILRETVGREVIDVEEALAAVLTGHPAWQFWRQDPRRGRAALGDLLDGTEPADPSP